MKRLACAVNWQRKGDMGMICEPYRVGKFKVGDHLKYRLWCNAELIGEFGTFEECERKAEEHARGRA